MYSILYVWQVKHNLNDCVATFVNARTCIGVCVCLYVCVVCVFVCVSVCVSVCVAVNVWVSLCLCVIREVVIV